MLKFRAPFGKVAAGFWFQLFAFAYMVKCEPAIIIALETIVIKRAYTAFGAFRHGFVPFAVSSSFSFEFSIFLPRIMPIECRKTRATVIQCDAVTSLVKCPRNSAKSCIYRVSKEEKKREVEKERGREEKSKGREVEREVFHNVNVLIRKDNALIESNPCDEPSPMAVVINSALVCHHISRESFALFIIITHTTPIALAQQHFHCANNHSKIVEHLFVSG